ncbi:uncharacterized protein LOC123537326 [Mercenaria mercenaria]|uniref:uncharacterized protein LOC123537326 n=1 Tax=Mercenaria mercenaria TaxID=6596 RepID=UPI00234ECADE|nr:uncharacterized protein LOC123537326 [Mercenaria mercenaria]
MGKIMILFTGLAIIFSIFPAQATPECDCGREQFIRYARIPSYNTLLSLNEFDVFVVDRTMMEAYFGLIQPPAFAPDLHYRTTITRIPGSSLYMQSVDSESRGENAMCNRNALPLRPVDRFDSALFYRNETTTVQAVWSSCPEKYVWNMFCSNYIVGQRRCLLEETMFSLYIHGNMDDQPLFNIAEDLYRATGVAFGAINFKWFFTFGENTLC